MNLKKYYNVEYNNLSNRNYYLQQIYYLTLSN